MFEAMSVEILKAKHEDLLFQKLENTYFWAKNRFFAILTTQTHSHHFQITFNQFYGQKWA